MVLEYFILDKLLAVDFMAPRLYDAPGEVKWLKLLWYSQTNILRDFHLSRDDTSLLY